VRPIIGDAGKLVRASACEVSHISIGTVDATYQPRQVLILAKDDPAAAARNADSYEYLVESLYR
jgi:hypothetical protein